MSITYKRHKDYPESILIREFKGQVSAEEVMRSWKYMLDEKLIDDMCIGLVNDLLDCELLMSLEEFKKILGFMKGQEILKNILLAVVTNNPAIIVFPVFGEITEKELNLKAFSEMENAVEWIARRGNLGVSGSD